MILKQYERKNKQISINRFRGVEVITFALHAKGPRFDPGRKHFGVAFAQHATFSKFDPGAGSLLYLIDNKLYETIARKKVL